MNLLKRLVKEEEGQGMIEYILIVAFISIAAIAAITAVGGSVQNIWNRTSSNLDNAII